MKLFTFAVAPNPTKVELYLAEKAHKGFEVPLERIEINLAEGEQNSPEFKARNPKGGLPVLEMEDGRNLNESLAIIEYLEERFPQASMWGDTPETRALARAEERSLDLNLLLQLTVEVHATNSPIGLPPNPPVAARARERADISLGRLEARFADGRPFVMGQEVTVADGTIAAGIQFSKFFGGDPLQDFPTVGKWFEAYKTRDHVKHLIVV